MGRECSTGNTSTPIFGHNIAPREEGKIARERDVAGDGDGRERRKKNCITRSELDINNNHNILHPSIYENSGYTYTHSPLYGIYSKLIETVRVVGLLSRKI